MRFVPGSNLKTLLEREGVLEPARALVILTQVADALDAAHRRGLVHRDVKPANVLLDEEGHAYLADFGITKQVGSDSTQTGAIIGTLDYLAPEQIRSEPVDGRTDVFALACVLYECLAGTRRFAATRRSRRCGRTYRSRRRRWRATRSSIRWSRRRWPRSARTATRPARS